MASSLAPIRVDHLAAVRAVARVMDSAFEIPGTRIRLGLDSLLGLLPLVGDVIGSLIGSYIILIASQMNVPRAVLWRMSANLMIDTVVGAVPLVGDVLDVWWKANVKNVALLERALQDPRAARRESSWALGWLVLALVAITAAVVVLVWWLIHTFVH